MLSIMHRFCALSVEAVVNNPDPPMPVSWYIINTISQCLTLLIISLCTKIENLPAIAAASGQDKIGRFLQECISKTQVFTFYNCYRRLFY
jgi:hypothetical protein